jgi:hypothetical protein
MTKDISEYAIMTDMLLDLVTDAVDNAASQQVEAQKKYRDFDRTGAMFTMQAAHQSMLNALVTAQIATVTALDEIRATLEGKNHE